MTLLASRSQKVIFNSCDPSFCLRVTEGIKSYGTFSSEQLYEVWITRAGSPDYGYVVHRSTRMSKPSGTGRRSPGPG